jgi:7-cyano-7-deazaguanine synthase
MAKSVILYSGGMDSYCLSKIIPDASLLFIDTGTDDNKIEAQQLPAGTQIIKLPLVNWELPNKIIPFRNCFFVLAAAQQFSEIYLGATAGDTTKDKDFVFKAMMESLMNYFGSDFDKMGHNQRPFIVHMPFKAMTKSEILSDYIVRGFSIDSLLEESRSCYQGTTEQECGECRSCLRKYTALINNDMGQNHRFLHQPTKEEMEAFWEDSIKKGRGTEVTEIGNAVKKIRRMT